MESVLEKIKGSSILITGGFGFVGSALARRLLREGAREVRIFDLKQDFLTRPEMEKEKDDRLKIFIGDIRHPGDLDKAARGCDYVFHEAGLRVTRCAKEPRLAYEVMMDGTFNVLEACVKNSTKKIIHASSAIVYGKPLRLPLDEEHPPHDTTLYGVFKTANENLLRSFKENFGLNYLALRYFNIYGPGMNLFGSEVEVLVRWLDRIDAGGTPLIFGDGSQTLDWIYIDDVVEANVRALQSDKSGEIFNVCTGRETSVLALLQTLLEILDSDLKPEFRESRSVNQVERRFGNPEKAKKRLGFSAQAKLEEGLRNFVRWRESVLAGKRRPEVFIKVP